MEGLVAGMATVGGLKLSVRLLKSEAIMADKEELKMFLLALGKLSSTLALVLDRLDRNVRGSKHR